MTRKTEVWLVVALVFAVANLGGAVMAWGNRELLHMGAHLALAGAGGLVAAALQRRRAAVIAEPDVTADRLAHLERSLDAVAGEVERMGEGQRFMTKLFAERGSEVDGARPAPDTASEASRDARRSDS